MRFVLVLILLLFATPAGAASYYLSNSGSDGGIGAIGSPWASLDRLYDLTFGSFGALACGDSIFLERGSTFIANDGTDRILFNNRACPSTARITVDAYGIGAKPIINNGGISGWGVRIQRSSWITVQNLQITGNWTEGIAIEGGTNITIDSMVVAGISTGCIHIARASNTVAGNNSSNVTVSNSDISGCGAGLNSGEGLYIGTDQSQTGSGGDDTSGPIFVRNNTFHDNPTSANDGWEAIEIKQGITGATISQNSIYNWNMTSGAPGAIRVNSRVTNVVISNNRLENITGNGGEGMRIDGQATVTNNTIWKTNGACIATRDAQGTDPKQLITRNSCWTNTGTTAAGIIQGNTNANMSVVNNIIRGYASGNTIDPLFTNTATGDLTLSSLSSPAIDSCVADGLPKNGSVPTCGAYDPPRFAGCVVENATPNRVDVIFTNDVAPHILFGGVTGITVEVDGAPRTESAPTLSGTNIIQYTINTAPTFGQTVTWTASASSTITDSSLIGNSRNQRYVDTTTKTCKNNVGAAPASHVLTQSHFRIYRVPLVATIGAYGPITCPAIPTTAVTYYVAINEPGASNTTCNGLYPTNQGGANCPFKDFTAIPVREKLYKTSGGSSPTKNVTVKVRTGTYIIEALELFSGEPFAGIYINANGANANEFVVLTNYNNEVVTLDGIGKTPTVMEMYGDRVVIQGLRFANAPDRSAQIGATNTFFQCNTLTGGEDTVKNTTSVGPVTVYGNTFTGSVQAIDATTAQDWTVSFNTITNGTKGVGFKVGAQNNTVVNNTFSNLIDEAISMGGGGSINHINDYEAANIIARNNLIQTVGKGIQMLWCNSCQVLNNEINGASVAGIYLGSNETIEQSGCRSGLGCLPTTGAVVTGNTFQAITGNLFIAGKNPAMITSITAGTNNYCVTSGSAVFRWGVTDLTFTQWKTATGTDTTSSLNCPGASAASGGLDPLLPVNTRGAVIQTGYVILTAQIKCTGAACPSIGAKAQGSWDGATWFDLSDFAASIYKILNRSGGYLLNTSGGKVLQEGSNPNNVGFAGLTALSGPQYPQQGQTIPGCHDPTGLTPTNKGAMQRTSPATPTFQLDIGECLTLGAMLKLDRPIVLGVEASILRARWVDQTGTPFTGTYVPAEVTIVDNQLGVGF